MSLQIAEDRVRRALDRWQERGAAARFWLRDDDAVEPTPALERLLAITGTAGVPVTLAVIPEDTGQPLADYLARKNLAYVALHGWSHRNYASPAEKKQELGPHRPAAEVLDELSRGFDKLKALHGSHFLPMLVPPWNRIAPDLLPHLPGLGLRCLSVFGPERERGLPEINTHVDVMDWHGTRGGRDPAVLMDEVAARLDAMGENGTMGLLTHHLVHDSAVDDFLGRLFALTTRHPGCIWMCGGGLLAAL